MENFKYEANIKASKVVEQQPTATEVESVELLTPIWVTYPAGQHHNRRLFFVNMVKGSIHHSGAFEDFTCDEELTRAIFEKLFAMNRGRTKELQGIPIEVAEQIINTGSSIKTNALKENNARTTQPEDRGARGTTDSSQEEHDPGTSHPANQS